MLAVSRQIFREGEYGYESGYIGRCVVYLQKMWTQH